MEPFSTLVAEDDTSLWRGWLVAPCYTQHFEFYSSLQRCSCEAVSRSHIRQPIHAATCAGYLLVASYAIVDVFLPGREWTMSCTYGLLWGLSCLLLGCGAVFFHVSLTYWGEIAYTTASMSQLLVLLHFSRRCGVECDSIFEQVYHNLHDVLTALLRWLGGCAALLALQLLCDHMLEAHLAGLVRLVGVLALLGLVGLAMLESLTFVPQLASRHSLLASAAMCLGLAALSAWTDKILCEPEESEDSLQQMIMPISHASRAVACAALYSWIQRWSDDMILRYVHQQ